MTNKTCQNVALIIHCGAGFYPKDLKRVRKIQQKLKAFCESGFRFLKNHSAVETAVRVTRWLEDWPETNAGIGSMLQSDGKARLSASLMDGFRIRFSGVINIEKIKNPILVASLLQRENDRILASGGAFRFAKQKGFKPLDLRTEESIKRWKQMVNRNVGAGSPRPSNKGRGNLAPTHKYSTVGACALDRYGHLAAATSTGGKGMELVGRVSDSCLPTGNYANSYAAISATGNGEDIIEEALASTLATRATNSQNLEKSFEETFKEVRKRNRKLAAIGLDRYGKVFYAHTTEILYYAFQSSSRSGIFTI